VTLQLFGAVGSGRFEIDLTGDAPRYDVAFDLDQFRSEAFAGALAPRQTMEGALDLALHATLEGSTSDTLKRSLAGELSLQGRDLTLHGIDLDDEFSRYQATQNFNLVDLGAFFFVGPLGLAVTKGYDFAGIFAGTGSRSEIRALVSEWTITEGLAVAEDVALATPRNRIALKGGLDFPAGEFSDLTMALVDARGCAVIEQVIHGSFQAPQIEQPGILRTLAGPAIALLEQGLDLLPGEIDCEPFYTGSLAAPQ
jgi:AsmA protein